MLPIVKALIAGGGTFAVLAAVLKLAIGAEPAAALAYVVALVVWLAASGGWGALDTWLYGREPEGPPDWRRYFGFCTDHKVIGIQYLVTVLTVFVVAGVLALLMRLELARPGMQVMSHDAYNAVMSIHGIGMIVVALIGIMAALGNFAMPLMIGAGDMAFPRFNAVSFWLVPPAVMLLLGTFAAGGVDFGWTAYAPLSTKGSFGNLLFLLAFVTVGFSSIFGAVNFLATAAGLRAKGMTAWRIPIFVWAVVSAAIIALMATSVVAASLLMVIFDRTLGTAFFDPRLGGSALLYQHLFWFYSHPAVYIMILPALGVLLEILPVFSRKPLFAYRIAAVSFIVIVLISFIVWAHHLFTSGMWDALSIPFMVTTELISVPTGVVFLAALGTLWLGRLRLKTPMLFALGILVNFLVGGLTGIFLADVPTDLHFHDSWFVVAHFHYTVMGGAVFAFFAGIYYWFPKMTGRMLNEAMGKVHFWLFFTGFHATFIPIFWLGGQGMRRRVADFPAELAPVQMWVSLVAPIVAIAVAVFLYNLVVSWWRGEKAPDNPWEANTLEWTTPSPPPHGNFAEEPVVKEGPYEYGDLPA